MSFARSNSKTAPSLIRVLAGILFVLTGVIIYSLVGILFLHDVFLYGAMFIFSCIGEAVILLLYAIAAAYYRRRT